MSAYFPATYSILSAEALTTQILPDFDIGEIAACQFFSGGFNDTYRIQTTRGVIYYVRIYRRGWRTLSDIRHELDVSEVTDLIGKDAFFEAISDVEIAYRAATSGNQA